ncbi:MAG: leucine-rich repeat domain-containing protein [Candidatus Thorarchaeota archaeon]
MSEEGSDTIMIPYVDTDGTRKAEVHPVDAEDIIFRAGNAVEVDLTSVSSCKNLGYLLIEFNELQDVDLKPLRHCKKLHSARFNGNRLQSIDLSPLRSCKKLRNLELNRNQFQSIDLSPLKSCTELEVLGFSFNQLRSIDLTPLASCLKLESIYISDNQLEHIELSPLFKCMRVTFDLANNQFTHVDITSRMVGRYVQQRYNVTPFQWQSISDLRISYGRPNHKHGSWEFLHSIAYEGTSRRMTNDILLALGLGHLGMIEADLIDYMKSIPPKCPINEAVEKIEATVVKVLVDQIDKGRTTLGLDLERISEYPELEDRTDRILSLRDSEMKNVQTPVINGQADLRPLVLTVYGNELLTSMEMPIVVFGKEITIVKEAVEKLGYEFKTTDSSPASPTSMSSELKTFIFVLASTLRNEIIYFVRSKEGERGVKTADLYEHLERYKYANSMKINREIVRLLDQNVLREILRKDKPTRLRLVK